MRPAHQHSRSHRPEPCVGEWEEQVTAEVTQSHRVEPPTPGEREVEGGKEHKGK